mgnify:FL=1
MTDKKKLGDRGEAYTARYLEKQDFHIVERNWHSRYGEIDIIAENEEYLLFVEVKTRRAGSMVPGELAVTPQKQQKLRLTAESYLLEYPTDRQPRFDVAALIVEGDKLLDFTYYKFAF